MSNTIHLPERQALILYCLLSQAAQSLDRSLNIDTQRWHEMRDYYTTHMQEWATPTLNDLNRLAHDHNIETGGDFSAIRTAFGGRHLPLWRLLILRYKRKLRLPSRPQDGKFRRNEFQAIFVTLGRFCRLMQSEADRDSPPTHEDATDLIRGLSNSASLVLQACPALYAIEEAWNIEKLGVLSPDVEQLSIRQILAAAAL